MEIQSAPEFENLELAVQQLTMAWRILNPPPAPNQTYKRRKLGHYIDPVTVKRNFDINLCIMEGRLTYQEIGDLYGVTREWVRQIGKESGADQQHQAIKKSRKAHLVLQKAQTGYVTEEEAWQIIEEMPLCPVCKGPVLVSGMRSLTCSANCARAWVKLRFILSDAERQMHRLSLAKTILSHPNPKPSKLEWANKLVNEGPGAIKENRRWITPAKVKLLREFNIPFDETLIKRPKRLPSAQCSFIRKSGQRCKQPTRTDDGLCWKHHDS